MSQLLRKETMTQKHDTSSVRFKKLKLNVGKNNLLLLIKFLIPVAFTDVAVDIGEQFLNKSIAHAADVVETLASFGLAYVLVKFFVGVLGEVRQAGLVLVHDRPSYYKILICTLVAASTVVVLLIIIAETQLGVLLIQDLHGVTPSVSKLTTSAIAYLSVYPLIDAISWYHAGILLKWHRSTVVGAGSLADIFAQIVAVAVLLYTPLICNNALLVPILAAYAGVVTRCSIVTVAYFIMVYPLLKKQRIVHVSIFKLVSFTLPLMLSLGFQKVNRPIVNLLVAHLAISKQNATKAIAVLTAATPLGRLPYGWLNELKTIPPAFRKEKPSNNTPVIAGKTIGIFCFAAFACSAMTSIVLFWIPGVSVAVLERVIGIPHQLAVLCVDPLKLFALLPFAVGVRAPLIGWLTLHHQTNLILPSIPVRLFTTIGLSFLLPHLGLTGAFMGVLSLVSGFFTETLMIIVGAVCYSVWKRTRVNVTNENTLIKLDELSNTESDDPEQQTGVEVAAL